VAAGAVEVARPPGWIMRVRARPLATGQMHPIAAALGCSSPVSAEDAADDSDNKVVPWGDPARVPAIMTTWPCTRTQSLDL
jgi:hypothetical protein